MTARVPVLIVGGGPVGLALAGELGWRGIPCTLIEKSDGSIEQPKMDLVGIRTMEFCRRWGILDLVRDAPYPLDYPQDYIYVTGLNGYELGREPFPGRGFEPCPPESPQKRERVPQDMFDPILRRFAERPGLATLRYNCELVSFTETPDGVQARVRNTVTGAIETIEADYMAGTDGGASTVREQLGIGMTGNPALTYTTNVMFRCADFSQASRQGAGLPLHFHRTGGRVAHHRRGQRLRPLPHVDRRHAAEDQPRRGRHPRGAEARDGRRISTTRSFR